MDRREFFALSGLGAASILMGQENSPIDIGRIRSDWLALLGPFPERVSDPELVIREVFQDETHLRHHVKFRSEKDDWVTAWLMVPKKPRTTPGGKGTPAVLCIHPTTAGAGKDLVAGLSGNKPGSLPDHSEKNRAYGLELVQRGYVTLCIDLLTDGERVSSGLLPYDSRAFYQKHPKWSMVGKNLWDAMRSIDILSTRPEVDRAKIACVGHSLGGHSSLVTAAFDGRVRAAVCNGGVYGWMRPEDHWARPGGYAKIVVGEKAAPGVGRYTYIKNFVPYLKDPNKPVPVDFDDLMMMVCPRSLFVSGTNAEFKQYGMDTKLARLRQHYFEVLGQRPSRPDTKQFRGLSYPGSHDFPEEVRNSAWQWLDGVL